MPSTEAARAEPGDFLGSTNNPDLLAALFMGNVLTELDRLRGILRAGGERVSMTRALVFAEHVEHELDYLRSRLQHLNNDQPAVRLGGLVDVRA